MQANSGNLRAAARMSTMPGSSRSMPMMMMMMKGSGGGGSGGGGEYNCTGELLQRMEELQEEREELRAAACAEEEEKASIERDVKVLNSRLAEVEESLSRKYAFATSYDKTISEVEAAYSKILESSQALLHVLKTETIHMTNKRTSPLRDRSNSLKRMSIPSEPPY